jgi:putative ABC transport system substrate-binding protein
MRRREFIAGLGGVAAWPLAARAQEARGLFRLGVLLGAPRDAPRIEAFFDELRIFGFAEGQNLKIEAGGFGLRNDQFPEAAMAMAKSPPDVVFPAGDPAVLAARNAMATVPIVGLITDNAVASGLVHSLARPGGNLTGIIPQPSELDGKRQDILMEAAPGAHRMAALADPTYTSSAQLQVLQNAGRGRGVELSIFSARRPEEIVPAMNQAKASDVAAINVLAAPLFSFSRVLVIERATALRLPAIYEWPDMAEDGGLIGYGARFPLIYRQAARQVVKVLHGVRPADVPVELPTNFELVINLQAAKAIGYEVPAGLVLRADKVIE